jgi:LmbE family N-acetylglucosaminyl deacetylase
VDGQTDLVLFSAHADDEHLFFAGILPYYGAELGCQVQVVYLTNHPNFLSLRIHELLNGLWEVGIRTYLVIGQFPDINLPTIWETYGYFQGMGHSKDEMQAFILEQLRRFKPKVVVTHDFFGEYGHGMHMVMADLVSNGVTISGDPEQYPESAETYGVWDVPKTYIHLYKENPIVMDWDQPLERFGGMTAFQVSIQKGFAAHVSQRDDFWWFHSDNEFAKDLPRYNPCFYGLYRSTVGPDVEKNDFFENVTTYAQDRRAEEDRLAEEARLKAEEEARKQAEAEAQKQAQEDARRQEEEAKKRAEAQAQAKQREEQARDQAALSRQKSRTRLAIAAIAAAFLVIYAVLLRRNRPKKSP